MSAATFAAVAVTFYAAHQVGDYWAQTSGQAQRKGLPGWDGRAACAAHVATHSLTLAVLLALAWVWLALPLSVPWVCAGVATEAVSHYFADRRKPLERVADLMALGGFWRAGEGLATGAAMLDQAWHWGFLFVSALIVTGPR